MYNPHKLAPRLRRLATELKAVAVELEHASSANRSVRTLYRPIVAMWLARLAEAFLKIADRIKPKGK